MSKPDVDEVLNYLSIKFNKIFCDREFVSCVIDDFQAVLSQKNKCCVLVFPTLGPIYLKALRHQARIFDLAVINVASFSGRFKSIAVCHKKYIIERPQPAPKAPPAMDCPSRKKRPERPLYVPPAQRRSRLCKAPEAKTARDKPSLDEGETRENFGALFSLSDLVILNGLYSFPRGNPVSKSLHDCDFEKYIAARNPDFDWVHLIQVYNNERLSNCRTDCLDFRAPEVAKRHLRSYPFFDLSCTNAVQTESLSQNCAILVSEKYEDYDAIVSDFVENTYFGIVCFNCATEFIDLTAIGGGFWVLDNCEVYECQEETTSLCENSEITLEKTKVEQKTSETKKCDEKVEKNNTLPKEQVNSNEIVKTISDKKSSNNNNEHEQEKEIMRKTKENINRKTKPIMKYVDDNNDTLSIEKSDSVNNWEDLFDDKGQIQDGLLLDIVEKVGDNIKILTAVEDYTAYTNKPPEDLEHIVELYNFPSTLETHDLVQAFTGINSDAMYIKWVDDTHALLVLGSSTQAQRAVNMRNPLIKVRPMTAASPVSIDVANKSDLRPAMKRPPTNLQTARRLITSHLGQKSKLSKEQMAKERQDLKNAKEMKRLHKQNERDAWEGKIRSNVN